MGMALLLAGVCFYIGILYTNQTITDVYMNAGFESQRTFNRVFLEEYHMSPREYRKIEFLQQNL